MISTVLALLVLFVGVPLNVLVTVRCLIRVRQAPHIRVLRERFIAATFVLLGVVVFSLIFLNNDTLPPPFDVGFTKVVTRFAWLVIAIVPAVYWLVLDSE